MKKRTAKKSDKRRLVVALSDLHCGSSVALLPPGFTTLEGQEIGQSPIQKWLWECWLKSNEWLDGVVDGDPYSLVLNGDLVEGLHHQTTQIISADMNDHVEAAIHVLRDLCHKAQKSFVTRGTAAHTRNTEIVIGKALKLEVNEETRLPAWDRLTMDVCGIRAVFRHHITTTVRRNLAGTGLSIALAEEQIESANNGETIPRLVVCAHRHKYGKYEDDNGMCVVTPPWQVLTRWAHQVVTAARCKPGIVVFDWRDKRDGELPAVHSITCEAPKPLAVSP
jgi:hypothetical protein